MAGTRPPILAKSKYSFWFISRKIILFHLNLQGWMLNFKQREDGVMGKVIPYGDLARQHQLNVLAHKRREYREREDYLAGLRKLLFQVEGQMRQAEIRQLQ